MWDVAEAIAAILANPTGHVGKVYELTGPRSEDMHALAAEYSQSLGRPITDFSTCPWGSGADELTAQPHPDRHYEHFLAMARLHAANRYDRLTHDVESITDRPATSVHENDAQHRELFEPHGRPAEVLAASSADLRRL